MSGLVCPHCGRPIDLFKTGGGEMLAREMEVPLLGRIPLEPAIVESGDSGRPFTSSVGGPLQGATLSPAAFSFAHITNTILRQIERHTSSGGIP
jgi:hypothetical protein